MVQKEGESIAQFLARLKIQSVNCNFGDQENSILVDQLIEKCRSNELRRELLKISDLTLTKAREIALSFEAADNQAKCIELHFDNVGKPAEAGGFAGAGEIAAVAENENAHQAVKKCYRCGSAYHLARDPICKAKDTCCNECRKIGHFADVCRGGNTTQSMIDCKNKPKTNKREKVRRVGNKDDDSSDALNEHISHSYELFSRRSKCRGCN